MSDAGTCLSLRTISLMFYDFFLIIFDKIPQKTEKLLLEPVCSSMTKSDRTLLTFMLIPKLKSDFQTKSTKSKIDQNLDFLIQPMTTKYLWQNKKLFFVLPVCPYFFKLDQDELIPVQMRPRWAI